jgi:hypothetical protein
VACAAALAIAARIAIGPFQFPLRVTTPLNPEGWLGLACALLLATGAGLASKPPLAKPRTALHAAALAALIAAAFWYTLRFCFLADDFVLVDMAIKMADLRPVFFTAGGDGFFRPLGYVSLRWSAAWAGVSPAAWHATGLALHAANSAMAYLLAARLGLSRRAALLCAALFAIHGTRPEAVTWIAGRFDLLAAFFVLAALLLYLRSLAGPAARALRIASFAATARALRIASFAATALALLSKESAFALPFLLLLMPRQDESRPRWRARAASLWPFFAIAALAFAYRWRLLGGIGGYRDSQTGAPLALAFGWPTCKALAVRMWTALFFPINWSEEPAWWLKAAMLLYLSALLYIAATCANRRPARLGLGFALIAALPALQGLGFGSTLEGARLLYLPAFGFCLALAAALEGPGRSRIAAAAAVLLFHFAALQHNLGQWARVSDLARTTAIDVARCNAPPQRKVTAYGIAARIGGIPFLGNANPEQIQFLLRAPASGPQRTPAWDSARQRAVCAE